jgi:hypothetical protein
MLVNAADRVKRQQLLAAAGNPAIAIRLVPGTQRLATVAAHACGLRNGAETRFSWG